MLFCPNLRATLGLLRNLLWESISLGNDASELQLNSVNLAELEALTCAILYHRQIQELEQKVADYEGARQDQSAADNCKIHLLLLSQTEAN